jgi:hypothetical protein
VPKIITLAFAVVLTAAAVSLWFRSSVSETAASGWPNQASNIALFNLHHKADTKTIRDTKIIDRAYMFTELR